MIKMASIVKVKKEISLHQLPIGRSGKVIELQLEGVMRRRLMDLGFVPGSIIKAIRKSPTGDPIAYEVKGTVYGLRKEESSKIWVEVQDE